MGSRPSAANLLPLLHLFLIFPLLNLFLCIRPLLFYPVNVFFAPSSVFLTFIFASSSSLSSMSSISSPLLDHFLCHSIYFLTSSSCFYYYYYYSWCFHSLFFVVFTSNSSFTSFSISYEPFFFVSNHFLSICFYFCSPSRFLWLSSLFIALFHSTFYVIFTSITSSSSSSRSYLFSSHLQRLLLFHLYFVNHFHRIRSLIVFLVSLFFQYFVCRFFVSHFFVFIFFLRDYFIVF